MLVVPLAIAVSAVGTERANAHCDTMDGPVIIDAKKALDTGNVNRVLAWVKSAGEGAGYEGIKPAGSELNPAVKAADRAIEDGMVQPLINLLTKNLSDKVKEKFTGTIGRKKYNPDDVAAGREFVKAYVEYVHFAEGVYNTITRAGGHHEAEGHGHASGHGGHEAHLPIILSGLAGLFIGAGLIFAIQKRRA